MYNKEVWGRYYNKNKSKVLERLAEWHRKNPEKRAKYLKKYYEKHKDQVLEYQRRYRKEKKDIIKKQNDKRKDYKKWRQIKKEYNLNKEDYLELLSKQQGRCLICNVELFLDKKHQINVDHDHKTGKIRGLLCNDCNRGLGWFHDDITILYNAIKYLEHAQGV